MIYLQKNLLIDHKGFLKLIDFGFAKVWEGKTFTTVGIPEYIAPDILLNIGHGKPADWWVFGYKLDYLHFMKMLLF